MNNNMEQEKCFSQLIEPFDEQIYEHDGEYEQFHESEHLYHSKLRFYKLKTEQSLSSSLIQCFQQLKVKNKNKKSIHKYQRYSKFKYFNRFLKIKENINNKVQLNSQYEEFSFNIVSDAIEVKEFYLSTEQLY